MKKLIALLAVAVVFAGCGAPKAELLSYSSDNLGVSFDYLDLSFGQDVIVAEEGETVSLFVEGVSIVDMTVKSVDLSGDDVLFVLNQALLNNSEACVIEEISTDNNKTLYTFDSKVYPFGDEFDQNCLLTAGVYVFSGVMDKVLVVDAGKTAPYEIEDTESFVDSISLK